MAQTKYISSKRAARLTGYAQDYIGQLVRMNKLNATKVGKAWFVEEAGLMQHVNGSNRLPVPVKQLAEVEVRSRSEYVSRVNAGISYPASWGAINYLRDDSPLMPESISDKRDTAENNEIMDLGPVRFTEDDESFQVQIRKDVITQKRVSARSIDGVRFSVPENPTVHALVKHSDETFIGSQAFPERPLSLEGKTIPSIGPSFLRLLVAAALVSLLVFFVPLVG